MTTDEWCRALQAPRKMPVCINGSSLMKYAHKGSPDLDISKVDSAAIAFLPTARLKITFHKCCGPTITRITGQLPSVLLHRQLSSWLWKACYVSYLNLRCSFLTESEKGWVGCAPVSTGAAVQGQSADESKFKSLRSDSKAKNPCSYTQALQS